MRRILICVLYLVCPDVVRADHPISGPGVGEVARGFEVDVATGDDAGKTLDLLTPLKSKPVLLIFVGEMTRPAFGLLKVLDKYGRLRQPDGLEVVIVRVTDDAAGAARQAKLYFDQYDIKSTTGVARKEGPQEYGLSDQAQMTVLLINKEHRVLLNMARRAPDRLDFDDVRKAIDKLLGPSPVAFP
jgi:hypothetical protein